MANFLDESRLIWKTGRARKVSIDVENHFSNVFKAINAMQDVHSKSKLDINNIEAVFATFEMAKMLNTFPRYSAKEIADLMKSIKVLIANTIELKLFFPISSGKVGNPMPYKEFADLVEYLTETAFPKQSVSVITFNYDLACDYSFYKKNLLSIMVWVRKLQAMSSLC